MENGNMYKVVNEDPNIIARFTDEPFTNSSKLSLSIDPQPVKEALSSLMPFINNPSIDPLRKLKSIYKFADWYVKHAGILNQSICQKGCAHCCAIDVDVSKVEALYIAKNTPYTMVGRTKRIRAKYRNYCPMLDQETGSCTIYEYRPLFCRTAFAFDNPEYCKPENFEVSAVWACASSPVLRKLHCFLSDMSDYEYADMREWFAEFTTDPYNVIFDKTTKW